MSPLVYILVLNYCSLDDTLRCVEAIRNIQYPNFRLLVIDNDSPDGSGDALVRSIPSHELIRLHKNTGYAGGNNAGFHVALADGAKYVLVVNPDVYLPPECLSDYVRIFESDPTIGALNPVQLDPDGKVDSGFSQAVLSTTTPYSNGAHAENKESKTLFGAALMLPATTIRSVGGFDPLFFAYGEEEDLCRRIRNRGLRLIVTQLSPITHYRTKDSTRTSDFVLFLRLKGAYLYNLKNPQLGFRYALKHFLKDFIYDILGKRRNIYPFNKYPITLTHTIQAGIWVLRNIENIRQHRKLDETEAPFVLVPKIK